MTSLARFVKIYSLIVAPIGFYRGCKWYDYTYNIDLAHYEKYNINNEETSPKYFYSERMLHGFVGTCVFILPGFGFISLAKEIRRLEINLRGLDDEKNKKTYYELF
jgi:hypothetical protein